MNPERRHPSAPYAYQCAAWRLDGTRCTSRAVKCVGGAYTCAREGHVRQAESALRRARLERANRETEQEVSP